MWLEGKRVLSPEESELQWGMQSYFGFNLYIMGLIYNYWRNEGETNLEFR